MNDDPKSVPATVDLDHVEKQLREAVHAGGFGATASNALVALRFLQIQRDEARRVATKAYQDEQRADRVYECAKGIIGRAFSGPALEGDALEDAVLGALADMTTAFSGDEPPVAWEIVREELSVLDALEAMRERAERAEASGFEAGLSGCGPLVWREHSPEEPERLRFSVTTTHLESGERFGASGRSRLGALRMLIRSVDRFEDQREQP